MDDETIIAQCTPPGNGALALLRLSGIDAVTIASLMGKLADKKKLINQPTHTIHYGWITGSNGKQIDQVLFLLMRGPKTFTGQDVVEISTHNNPFIIDSIIERALQLGARPAQKGEFSKRAFLNGKLDLPQAEAINELIHAQTQMGLKASLAQLEGSLSQQITQIERDLLQALALSEASFEFVEEDTEFGSQIGELVAKTSDKIESLKKNFDRQQHIRQGIRIALIGSVNAGKSSLFNKLIQLERAIVTDVPGTTRDVIETGVYRDGTYQTFVDTAGLRKTKHAIELEGIRRSQQEAKKADIILLVYDASKKMNDTERVIYEKMIEQHGNKVTLVRNKIDLTSLAPEFSDEHETIHVSCKNGQHIDQLRSTITKKIQALFAHTSSPYLLNQRQYRLLLAVEKRLALIPLLLEKNPAYELISAHLKDTLVSLSEFSGKTISEQGLDLVFKTFCVGK